MEQEQQDEYRLGEYLTQTESMLTEMNKTSLAVSTTWFHDEQHVAGEELLGSWSISSSNDDENLPPCPSGKSFEWQDPSDCSSSEASSTVPKDAFSSPVLSKTDMISSWWKTNAATPIEYYETVEARNATTNITQRTRWCCYCSCLGGGGQQSFEKKFIVTNARNKLRLSARFWNSGREQRRLLWRRNNKRQPESSSSPLLEAGSW